MGGPRPWRGAFVAAASGEGAELNSFDAFAQDPRRSRHSRRVRGIWNLVLSIVLLPLLPLSASPALNPWTQVSSPPGGYIRRILAQGSYAQISTSRGPFQSLDQGRTWRKLDSLEPAFRIHSLYSKGAKASKGDTLFGGTPTESMKSDDGGRTWFPILPKASKPEAGADPDWLSYGKYVFRLSEAGVQRSTNPGGPSTTVFPRFFPRSVDGMAMSHGNIYLLSSGDLFCCGQDGYRWYHVRRSELEHKYIRRIHAEDSSLRVSTKWEEFRSEDGGNSWSQIPRAGSGPGEPGIHGIAKGDSFWLALTHSALLRRSQDQGRSWTLIDPGIEGEHTESLVAIDSLLFAGSRHSGFFRSGDGGATWTPMIFGSEVLESGSLVRFRGDLVLGNSEGVFRSGNDGETWSRVRKGWNESWHADLAVEGDRLFAATDTGLFHAVDSAGAWSLIHPLGAAGTQTPISYLNAIAVNGPTLFVSSRVFSLIRSRDSGKSWDEVPNWFHVKKPWRLFVKDGLIFAPSTNGLYLGGRTGRTWKQILRGAEYTEKSRGYGVVAVAGHGATLFAGSDEGQVYASRDNGSQWVRLKPGLPMGFVSGLAVCDSSLYAMVEDMGIWRRALADIEREELLSMPGVSGKRPMGKRPRGKRRHPPADP